MSSTATLDLIIRLADQAAVGLRRMEERMATAYYYDESKNPDGAYFGGVPLGNISEEEFESYPKWLQQNIAESPMYRKTNPNPEPREKKEP